MLTKYHGSKITKAAIQKGSDAKLLCRTQFTDQETVFSYQQKISQRIKINSEMDENLFKFVIFDCGHNYEAINYNINKIKGKFGENVKIDLIINFSRGPKTFEKILESDSIKKIIPIKSASSRNYTADELHQSLLSFNEKISKKVHLIENGDIEKTLDWLFETKLTTFTENSEIAENEGILFSGTFYTMSETFKIFGMQLPEADFKDAEL